MELTSDDAVGLGAKLMTPYSRIDIARRRQRKMPHQGGFTLIELVIVILTMGILLAAATPKYMEANNRFRTEAAAKRMVADLLYVRNRAIMTSSKHTVFFKAEQRRYQLKNVPGLDRPSESPWVRFDETAYSVDIVSCLFTNTAGETDSRYLYYDKYGRATCKTSSGTLPLTSGEIVVTAGASQRTVVIDAGTGKARIQ